MVGPVIFKSKFRLLSTPDGIVAAKKPYQTKPNDLTMYKNIGGAEIWQQVLWTNESILAVAEG